MVHGILYNWMTNHIGAHPDSNIILVRPDITYFLISWKVWLALATIKGRPHILVTLIAILYMWL